MRAACIAAALQGSTGLGESGLKQVAVLCPGLPPSVSGEGLHQVYCVLGHLLYSAPTPLAAARGEHAPGIPCAQALVFPQALHAEMPRRWFSVVIRKCYLAFKSSWCFLVKIPKNARAVQPPAALSTGHSLCHALHRSVSAEIPQTLLQKELFLPSTSYEYLGALLMQV